MAILMKLDRYGRLSTEREAFVKGRLVVISHRNPDTGEYWVKSWEERTDNLLKNCWVKVEAE